MATQVLLVESVIVSIRETVVNSDSSKPGREGSVHEIQKKSQGYNYSNKNEQNLVIAGGNQYEHYICEQNVTCT